MGKLHKIDIEFTMPKSKVKDFTKWLRETKPDYVEIDTLAGLKNK